MSRLVSPPRRYTFTRVTTCVSSPCDCVTTPATRSGAVSTTQATQSEAVSTTPATRSGAVSTTQATRSGAVSTTQFSGDVSSGCEDFFKRETRSEDEGILSNHNSFMTQVNVSSPHRESTTVTRDTDNSQYHHDGFTRKSDISPLHRNCLNTRLAPNRNVISPQLDTFTAATITDKSDVSLHLDRLTSVKTSRWDNSQSHYDCFATGANISSQSKFLKASGDCSTFNEITENISPLIDHDSSKSKDVLTCHNSFDSVKSRTDISLPHYENISPRSENSTANKPYHCKYCFTKNGDLCRDILTGNGDITAPCCDTFTIVTSKSQSPRNEECFTANGDITTSCCDTFTTVTDGNLSPYLENCSGDIPHRNDILTKVSNNRDLPPWYETSRVMCNEDFTPKPNFNLTVSGKLSPLNDGKFTAQINKEDSPLMASPTTPRCETFTKVTWSEDLSPRSDENSVALSGNLSPREDIFTTTGDELYTTVSKRYKKTTTTTKVFSLPAVSLSLRS